MKLMNVTIVQTGTANLASVVTAFERLGCGVEVSRSPATIESAARVILPGVGTFAAGRQALDASETTATLRDRLRDGRPTLGICLGWQLFAASSEESDGVEGLGVIPSVVQPFAPGARSPQMGWNRVASNDGLVTDGWAYFANSYALKSAPDDWSIAWANHDGEQFAAAAQRGAVLGCQFHPELSGAWGLELLERWLKETSC